MGSFIEINISGSTVQVIQPEAEGAAAPITGYRTYDYYLGKALDIYERAEKEFFAILPEDPALLKAAKRWERASVSLLRWAASLANKFNASDEDLKRASDLMDRLTKDSAIRADNISQHYALLAASGTEDDEALEIAELAELEQLDALTRMINTQTYYIRLWDRNCDQLSVEQAAELEESEHIRETYSRIPPNHVYRPIYIYPPERVPEDEPVPAIPDPYARVMDIPRSEKIYDEDLDEFVLPPGYVSEDGLIDDKSAVYFPETHEVEFGYVGGIRGRWKYWKAETDRDVIDPDSWFAQYYRRWYDRFVREPEAGVLQHREYEDPIPDYNRIPKRE